MSENRVCVCVRPSPQHIWIFEKIYMQMNGSSIARVAVDQTEYWPIKWWNDVYQFDCEDEDDMIIQDLWICKTFILHMEWVRAANNE